MQADQFKNNPELIELLIKAYEETIKVTGADKVAIAFFDEDNGNNNEDASTAQVKLEIALEFPNGWDKLEFTEDDENFIEVNSIPWKTAGAIWITKDEKKCCWYLDPVG